MSTASQRLTDALPPALRPFILVDSVELPSMLLELVAVTVTEAGMRIAEVVRPDRTSNMIIGRSPFRLLLANGEVVFTPNPDVIAGRVNNLIFVDAERLAGYAPKLRVAALLEEFVHVMLGVADEAVVMAVVATLYPEVSVVDGRYVEAVT